MREFVNQYHCRFARQYGVYVHLLEDCPLVFDLAAGNGIQSGCQVGDWLTSMRLNDSNRYVFSPAVTTDGLAAHVVSFAYGGGVSKKKFEYAFLFLASRLFRQLTGILAQSG